MKAISSAESLLLSAQAQLQRRITVSNQYCCGQILAVTQRTVYINPQLIPNPISFFLFPTMRNGLSDSSSTVSVSHLSNFVILHITPITLKLTRFTFFYFLLISFSTITSLWRPHTDRL